MISLLFALTLSRTTAAVPPEGCADLFYYRRVIEQVIRTNRASYGLLSDQTNLDGYFATFGARFEAALATSARWINFGSGTPRAELELLERFPGGPLVTSISAHGAEPIPHERHTFLGGRMIEQTDFSKVPKADVASDRFGPLSYSPQFDEALRIELDALAPDGLLFVVLQTGRTSFWDGQVELTFEQFVGRVGGVTLDGSVRQALGRSPLMTAVLRRGDGPVTVPKLKLRDLKMMLPPYRVYDL